MSPYRDMLMTAVFSVTARSRLVRFLAWGGRHALGWAVAGAIVGVMDALLVAAKPGTEAFEPSVVASALALDVGLHMVFGAVVGLLLGRSLVLLSRSLRDRWARLPARTRRRLLAAGAVGGLGAFALGWIVVGQWIEWDAVDWRLPLLGLGLLGLGVAASELSVRWRHAIFAVGLLLMGCVTGASLWTTGASRTGDAAARLGEDAATGRWLLVAARDLLDSDGDGFPSGLCAVDCDCDDGALGIHPGAAEIADNGVDEDCDGQDLSRAATLVFEALMAAAPIPDDALTGDSGLAPAIPLDAEQGPSAPTRPPNMLFITVDTLRADHLGLYGYVRPTSPNLDRLAERCAVFDQARATGSQTRFSVPPMVTGKYFTEIARTEGLWPRILEEEVTVAEELSDAGYHTAAFHSISYLRAQYGFAQGFDHYDSSVIFARPN
ncbi:MAG: sulfatase-like hydrolase/transferase, partial [Myxococcota bacterium]|nr:sulfatase-like hydrolase/transferase [Myxococcota bacterium]